jgi:peptidoglycan/LPS O-acetylase OafA/YrhL
MLSARVEGLAGASAPASGALVPSMSAPSLALPRMDWIDYGRLIAALWVMLAHYCFVALDPRVNAEITSYGLLTTISSYGMIGLDFFFIASGLVVFRFAQGQSTWGFGVGRIARVYPNYLLAMILTTLISQYGRPGGEVHLARFLADLFMAAPLFGMKHVDTVYWTLVVEVQFYFALWLLKVVGWLQYSQRVVTIWISLMLLCFALRIELPLLGTSFHCLAGGVVLSLIYRGENVRFNGGLLALIAGMCFFDAYHYSLAISINPSIFVALTAMIFPIFLLLRGRTWRLPFARRIGSLTYPLFLLHFHIGLVVIYRFGTEANKYFLLAALCLGMIVVSAVIDDVMEMRLRGFWIRLVDRALGLIARLIFGVGRALRSPDD